MKIFNSTQIHELDNYTIEHEPISSINLMERAAKALTQAITNIWTTKTPFVVFAGPGNNGGDGFVGIGGFPPLTRKLFSFCLNCKLDIFVMYLSCLYLLSIINKYDKKVYYI